MLRDALAKLYRVMTLVPAEYNTDQNGTSVDLQENRSLGFLALIGASGDTLSGTVRIELKLEESDNNSDWTACPDVAVQGAIAGVATGTFAVIDDGAEDAKLYQTQYLGHKRYVRCVVDFVGTHTNGTPLGIVAVDPNPEKMAIALGN